MVELIIIPLGTVILVLSVTATYCLGCLDDPSAEEKTFKLPKEQNDDGIVRKGVALRFGPVPDEHQGLAKKEEGSRKCR